MPLLKREPDIWPPHLFGEAGGGPAPDGARTAPPQEDEETAATPLCWWVARTRSRQEKHLARHLLKSEVRYYLPQREHRYLVSGRWRTSHVPLFTGYLFFQGDLRDRLKALRSNRIVHLIEVPNAGELVSQLRSIWLLQRAGAPLVPHPYLAPGDEVEIVDGPLRGYRGTVEREKGKYRLVVSITLLRSSVAAEVPRDALVPASLRRAS